jgi:hypothetical protein
VCRAAIPPPGRQLIADKTALLADVLPASPDGTLRALLARVRPGETYSVDMSLLTAPPGAPPSERPLAEQVGWGVGCTVSPCFPTDARGRIFMSTSLDPMGGDSLLMRIDPETGEKLELGRQTNFALSPSGQRLLLSAYDYNAGYMHQTLYEADDRPVTLPDAAWGSFVGEDLFYVTNDMSLMRLRPNGAPELVRGGVNSFGTVKIETGMRLFVYVATDDLAAPQTAIIDPVTLEEIVAPIDAGYVMSLSPDGRWLLSSRPGAIGAGPDITLLDVTTGAKEDVDIPADTLGQSEWRPGHTELWMQSFDPTRVNEDGSWTPGALIKRPGEPPVAVAISLASFSNPQGQSFFTSDGQYWFSIVLSKTMNRSTAMVGTADDPTAPPVKLNPEGTATYGYRPLADGRLLIEAFRVAVERSDIYAVDPTTGASRLLGELGAVLAAGDRRVLANLHNVDGRGDLTVIDLETETATTLAREFASAAFVERGTSPDAVAPGARVVYRFQARFDSPYDGIWVAAIP